MNIDGIVLSTRDPERGRVSIAWENVSFGRGYQSSVSAAHHRPEEYAPPLLLTPFPPAARTNVPAGINLNIKLNLELNLRTTEISS